MIRAIWPGVGRKLLSGSSALMRHSIAQPRTHDVFLLERQRLAGGDADLRLDQVDAGDHFRDRMLDLDAGVHLDEVEVALLVDDELDGAGVVVVGQSSPAARPPRTSPSAFRRPGWERGSPRSASGGGAASCNRAPRDARALPCMVGDDLHFDVPRDARRIFPGRSRQLPKAASASAWACCKADFRARSFAATRMPRPPPPAEALISTGKPNCWANCSGLGLALDQPFAARHGGHFGLRAILRAEFLSPSRAMASGVGPMKVMLQSRQTSAKWEFSDRKP